MKKFKKQKGFIEIVGLIGLIVGVIALGVGVIDVGIGVTDICVREYRKSKKKKAIATMDINKNLANQTNKNINVRRSTCR